jgi:hypothetical protein
MPAQTDQPKKSVRMPVRAALLALGLSLLPVSAFAGPEGSYDMSGINPGDESVYEGKVTVKRTGETYAVNWQLDNNVSKGIGALTTSGGSVFAVSFDLGSTHGIALFELGADGVWNGRWSAVDGVEMGSEVWTPSGATNSDAADAKNQPASAVMPQTRNNVRQQ